MYDYLFQTTIMVQCRYLRLPACHRPNRTQKKKKKGHHLAHTVGLRFIICSLVWFSGAVRFFLLFIFYTRAASRTHYNTHADKRE